MTTGAWTRHSSEPSFAEAGHACSIAGTAGSGLEGRRERDVSFASRCPGRE